MVTDVIKCASIDIVAEPISEVIDELAKAEQAASGLRLSCEIETGDDGLNLCSNKILSAVSQIYGGNGLVEGVSLPMCLLPNPQSTM